VTGIDAFWSMKVQGQRATRTQYEAISVPRHSAVGFVIAFFAVILGFALIWHIEWLALIALLCVVAVCLTHAWRVNTEMEISAEELAEIDARRQRQGSPA